MPRNFLLGLAICLGACGTEPSRTGPVGAWHFDASWGDSATPCTISGSTLTISHTHGKWTGTLQGGDAHCEGIPGEAPVLQNPPDAVLDSVRVYGDSVRFVLDSGASVFRGRFAETEMDGVVELYTFCQCTGPSSTGTWTATLP